MPWRVILQLPSSPLVPLEGWRPPPPPGVATGGYPQSKIFVPFTGPRPQHYGPFHHYGVSFRNGPGLPPAPLRSVTPTGVPWTLGGWVPLKKKPGPAPPRRLGRAPREGGGLQPAAGLGHHPSRGHALPPLVTSSAATSDPDGVHPPCPSHSRPSHRTHPTVTALRPSCPSHVFARHTCLPQIHCKWVAGGGTARSLVSDSGPEYTPLPTWGSPPLTPRHMTAPTRGDPCATRKVQGGGCNGSILVGRRGMETDPQ